MTIASLIRVIRLLPSDRPVEDPAVWYRTQKEHWLRWLSEYHGPGAYGRKSTVRRDAAYAYNHVVQSKMLVWLIRAAGMGRAIVADVTRADAAARTLAAKSGAVRRVVPWDILEPVLERRLRASTRDRHQS